MSRTAAPRLAASTLLLCAAWPAVAHAQLVTTLVGPDNLSFSCVTVGPLAPFAQEYCVRRTEAEGFLVKKDVGVSGLTIGDQGGEDDVVTAVAAGSPAAAAGLQPGDMVIAVDGEPVRRPASEAAKAALFGPSGETVTLSILRDGAPLQRSVKRAPAPEPANTPHSPNLFIGLHPMVNWRGIILPCMGAGPLGPAAIGICISHYRKAGFVRTSSLGSTGLTFDSADKSAAVVAAVEPDSPAAVADIRPGDVLTAVDGYPPKLSLGKAADERLFGKASDSRRLTVARDGRDRMVQIILAPAP